MNKTQIEWVKNPDGSQGYSINPITGCLNNCPYCYARRLANTRLRERYLANKNVAPLVDGWYHDFGKEGYVDSRYDAPFYPRFWPERLWLHDLVGSKRKPKGIFVCDMSDLFGIGVPEEWTRRVLDVIRLHPRHRFYLLTKQSQNLEEFSPFPDNCWVGVSATNQANHNEAITCLSGIEPSVKFLSYEPLLDDINIDSAYDLSDIQWVIIGGQSGKDRWYPPEDWIEGIESACDEARIPVFEKPNLRPSSNPRKLRQEMPE